MRRRGTGCVVHLTTHPDLGVSPLLAPISRVLARSGMEQSVVLIDTPRSRDVLLPFHKDTGIVRVPQQRNLLAQWHALGAAFARTVVERRPDAVHLHGVTACLLGERMLDGLQVRIPAFHSPHRLGKPGLIRPLIMLASQSRLGGRGSGTTRAMSHGPAEVPWMEGLGHRSVAILEGPVDQAYFDVAVDVARRPLIVSASRSGKVCGVEAFDQLAVLLGGDAMGMCFHWIGPVDAVSAARLKAARVGLLESTQHADRAALMAQACMYVALKGDEGFPLCLAEAMAAGLPCVALDTPAHRSLVRHGDTGYLCRNQAEVIDRMAQLADTPSLRDRMGRAGRALACERFGQAPFEHALFAAYFGASEARAPASRRAPTRQGSFGAPGVP